MGLLQRCKQLFHAVGTGEHCPRIRLPGQRLQHVRRRSLRVDQADFHRLCSTETKLFCRLAGIRRCTGQQYLLPDSSPIPNHDSCCRRETTSPITVIAGVWIPCRCTSAAISESGAVTTRCRAVVPRWITAAGVSGDFPAVSAKRQLPAGCSGSSGTPECRPVLPAWHSPVRYAVPFCGVP